MDNRETNKIHYINTYAQSRRSRASPSMVRRVQTGGKRELTVTSLYTLNLHSTIAH